MLFDAFVDDIAESESIKRKLADVLDIKSCHQTANNFANKFCRFAKWNIRMVNVLVKPCDKIFNCLVTRATNLEDLLMQCRNKIGLVL